MTEPITVSLTPAQVAEFAQMVADAQGAQKIIDAFPIARNYAARAIVLGHYPLAMFDGRNLHIDLDRARIAFEPNAVMPSSAPDAAQETVS